MARNKIAHTSSIQVYWNVRDELSEVESVILKNDRILVPSSMRKEMLQRIHQGHKGSKNPNDEQEMYYAGQRHDIEMYHLLIASTAKRERANDSFSHTE